MTRYSMAVVSYGPETLGLIDPVSHHPDGF